MHADRTYNEAAALKAFDIDQSELKNYHFFSMAKIYYHQCKHFYYLIFTSFHEHFIPIF